MRRLYQKEINLTAQEVEEERKRIYEEQRRAEEKINYTYQKLQDLNSIIISREHKARKNGTYDAAVDNVKEEYPYSYTGPYNKKEFVSDSEKNITAKDSKDNYKIYNDIGKKFYDDKDFEMSKEDVKRVNQILKDIKENGYGYASIRVDELSGVKYDRQMTVNDLLENVKNNLVWMHIITDEKEQKFEPKSEESTINDLKTLDYYEKEVVPTLEFKTDKDFNPYQVIVRGKEALEKMASLEKKNDAIRRALTVLPKEEFKKTRNELTSLKEKQDKEHKKLEDSLEKEGIQRVRAEAEAHKKMVEERERKAFQTKIYGELYEKMLDYRRLGDPEEVERCRRDLEDFGQSMDPEERLRIKGEIDSKRSAQRAEEIAKENEMNHIYDLRRETREKLRHDYTGNGLSDAEIDNVIEGQIDRLVEQRLEKEREQNYFNSLTREAKEDYLRRKDGISIDYNMPKKEIFNAKEAAFEQMKKDPSWGFEENATLDSLNAVQKSQVDYYARANMDELLEKFNNNKKAYESYNQAKREQITKVEENSMTL